MFRALVISMVVLGFSCGSSRGGDDAGDSPDASVIDAGTLEDAGVIDAGIEEEDAGVIDAGIASSQGTGGVTCISSANVDATHTACLSKVNDTSFKLTTPVGGSGPYYLGIYLHGDGAGAYNSNSAVKRMLTLADQKHVLQIAVLAPNGCAWWQDPGTPFDSQCNNTGSVTPDTSGLNAQSLAEVIDAVRAAYDIRNDLVLYYSASGGSIFLTNSFIPSHGSEYPGGMSINCGAQMPADSAFTWDTSDVAARGSTQMFFTYGDSDPVVLPADVHATVVGYAAKNFVVDEKILPGVQHCGPTFDAHARALEVWTQVLGQ
jgi:hypothetical protein